MHSTRMQTLVEIAQQIGTDYLARHPKKSYFHNNQGWATEMQGLDASLTKEQLEQNLITFYLELPNVNGQLALAIEDFFSEILHKTLSEEVIIQYWKSLPLVAVAREIGGKYLKDHPKPGLLGLHTNQELAKDLVFLENNIGKEDLENKLINCYIQLPNFNGELAQSIRHFFDEFLQKPLTQQMLINNISVETYQKIGADYLKKYPKCVKRKFFGHTNQQFATPMAEGKVYGTNEKVEGPGNIIWKALLEVYKFLPFNNGYLANRIERLFQNVFNVTFDHVKPVGNTRASVAVSREHIAREVTKKIEPSLTAANTFQVSHA